MWHAPIGDLDSAEVDAFTTVIAGAAESTVVGWWLRVDTRTGWPHAWTTARLDDSAPDDCVPDEPTCWSESGH